MGRRGLTRPWRSLRLRVPATAMAVFAISLAVAAALAYELFLQDGRSDIDTVIAREQQRFQLSVGELLGEVMEEEPQIPQSQALRQAVRRYLELNPANESYWTVVQFEPVAGGGVLASANGPPSLAPLFPSDIPEGALNTRDTVETQAGDVRASWVPVLLGDERVATLTVMSPLSDVRDEAREATGMVVAAAAASLLLGGILLAASLWRSLTPLGALADAARSTELRTLDARVDVPDSRDEVAVVAREFNTMLDRLDKASAAQNEFMASVGHELRTPITVARGHLELLRTTDRTNPEAVAETTAIVEDELRRMGRLVEDLMAIARSDMADFTRPRDLDLVGWFEELEVKLTGLGVTTVRIEPPPPVTLHADPDRLAQAVLNLVVNAHVHTPEGTPIRVFATLADGRLAVSVSDNGPGIPPEIKEDAFAPFIRGDAPTSTGLGLSVVRAVVDAHHGTIDLETGPGGTTVSMWLPWTGTADDGAIPEDDDGEIPQLDDPDRAVEGSPKSVVEGAPDAATRSLPTT